MRISLKVLGAAEIVRHLSSVKSKMGKTLEEGMRESAFQVERFGKMQLTSGPNRALKTGYLRASLMVTSILPYRAVVTAQANYGIYIHEGTRSMRARPYLEAGLKQAVPEIEKIFGKRIKTLVETI